MATLDSLPPDQRAVLQLVLQRGRSYDQIAAMLSIDRANVRQRALAALGALGPQTHVEPERRALLTDYLLGQLPARVAADTRARLAVSASERAWARVLASELAPFASGTLPEIPTEDSVTAQDTDAYETPDSPAPAGRTATAEPVAPTRAPADAGQPAAPGEPATRRSSRVGGAILLGLGALIAVIVVLVVLLSSGSSKKHAATTTPVSTSTGTTSTTPTRVIAQINLNAPNGATTPKGVAQVVKQGANTGIIIVAQSVVPNTKHDAYAVWLFKPGAQGRILGFVNPGVGTNGRLQTAGGLPADAAQFTQLLVTRESQANPKTPGTIILQGTLKLG